MTGASPRRGANMNRIVGRASAPKAESPRKRLLARLATLAGLLLLWFLASSVAGESPLYPSPAKVASAAFQMALEGILFADLGISALRVTLGFAIGGLGGILLGILTGRLVSLDVTIGQVLIMLRPIPSIAIVPFVIIWVGISEPGKLTIISWAALFPTWIGTHLGVVRSNLRYEWVARSCGADEMQIIASVVVPNALPMMVAGLRTSLGAAFVSLFAAEMVGGPSGVGYRIHVSHMSFQPDRMLVGLICLAAMGAAADALFLRSTARMAPWIFSSSHK